MSLTRDEYEKEVLAIGHARMCSWLDSAPGCDQSREDLAQDVYERLFGIDEATLGKVSSVEDFAPGVAQDVVKLCRAAQEAESSVERVASCDVFPDEKQDPAGIVNSHQEIALASDALERLPERQRTALLLRNVHGCSGKQIAHSMGVQVTTGKRLLHNAKQSFPELVECNGARLIRLRQRAWVTEHLERRPVLRNVLHVWRTLYDLATIRAHEANPHRSVILSAEVLDIRWRRR